MVDKKGKITLPTGAPDTREGTAVLNLLRNVWAMRTFGRTPSKAKAQLMTEKKGHGVRQGSHKCAPENKALQEISRAIQVRTFKKHGLARETRHGKILVNAAKTARSKHFIRRSFDDVQGNTAIQRVNRTWDTEQYMRSWLACNHLPAVLFQ